MISVVLVGAQWGSNVGLVARVMANLGFGDLVLVKPRCKYLSKAAIMRAKHAVQVLKGAQVIEYDDLEKFDYLIAMTSKLGTDYNLLRTPIGIKDLPKKLESIGKFKKIGIVFGREGDGLYNYEVEMCDMVATIPANPSYKSFNLSHAVALVLYEISREKHDKAALKGFPGVGGAEKRHLLDKAYEIVDKAGFETKEKTKTQKRIWKNLLGRSGITQREAYVLFGYFNQIKKRLR